MMFRRVSKRKTRRYDKERGCYVYDIAFKTQTPITERTIEVAEAFGLGIDEDHEHVLYEDFELKLAEGDIVYITGDSGSGKSVLLKEIASDLGDETALMEELLEDSELPIIDLVGSSFHDALNKLSLVGLNDAFLFLRLPRHLSDGQKYRFKIAQLMDKGKKYWLCDEFCSTLDRTTARIVAYNIQKHARRSNSTLIVSTTHKDLRQDLKPSIYIHKGWGKEIEIEYRPNAEPSKCTVARDVEIQETGKREFQKLAYLHYRSHRIPVPIKIFSMLLDGETIGVIAYTYPSISSSGRKIAVGYTPKIEELNRDWATVGRVIIHPKYRSIGLGSKIVEETLPLVDRKHVELVAVMAQYSPFAERAGMKKILLTSPSGRVLKTIDQLRSLGFNPALLSSRQYNVRKLRELGEEKLAKFKDALIMVDTPFYRRLARLPIPYMKKALFIEWIEDQDIESLAWSLQNLAILAQSKAYLYWTTDWMEDSHFAK
jgi:ABC-type lipoprotein export system ATPase subunit/GNAT superfamily N-acetyltransferase